MPTTSPVSPEVMISLSWYKFVTRIETAIDTLCILAVSLLRYSDKVTPHAFCGTVFESFSILYCIFDHLNLNFFQKHTNTFVIPNLLTCNERTQSQARMLVCHRYVLADAVCGLCVSHRAEMARWQQSRVSTQCWHTCHLQGARQHSRKLVKCEKDNFQGN